MGHPHARTVERACTEAAQVLAAHQGGRRDARAIMKTGGAGKGTAGWGAETGARGGLTSNSSPALPCVASSTSSGRISPPAAAHRSARDRAGSSSAASGDPSPSTAANTSLSCMIRARSASTVAAALRRFNIPGSGTNWRLYCAGAEAAGTGPDAGSAAGVAPVAVDDPTSITTGSLASRAAAISTRHHTRKKAQSCLAASGTFPWAWASGMVSAAISGTWTATRMSAPHAWTTLRKSRSNTCSGTGHCRTAKMSTHTNASSGSTWAMAAIRSWIGAFHVWLENARARPTTDGSSSATYRHLRPSVDGLMICCTTSSVDMPGRHCRAKVLRSQPTCTPASTPRRATGGSAATVADRKRQQEPSACSASRPENIALYSAEVKTPIRQSTTVSQYRN
eukprot:scaffold2021_cov121-Isochrysis_galbana.AAC.2